ncbi:MAG TPA: YitT family protein, partial [Petrotogaceae bacterium]|nr:YitT family protein [Petrotogaceae bacterium]
MTKKIKIFQTYFIIAFGLFVNSIGWTAFLIPSKVIGGGLTGVGTLIYYITGFPVGISYLVMNFFLIVIAIKILGKKFGVKTIFAICLTSLYTTIFQQIFKTPLVNDSFMATIIGAGLGGAGIGIVFTQGGSTGGTDIIAMIINK